MKRWVAFLVLPVVLLSGFWSLHAEQTPPLAPFSSPHLPSISSRDLSVHWVARIFNDGECVALEDTTFWRIHPDARRFVRFWAQRDIIRIDTSGDLNFPAKIINESRHEYVFAVIHIEPKAAVHRLSGIMLNGGYLLFNDGSLWEVRMSDHSEVYWKWRKADPTVIYYSGDYYYPYRLTNTNRDRTVLTKLIRGPSSGPLKCNKITGCGETVELTNGYIFEVKPDDRSNVYWHWFEGNEIHVGFSDNGLYPYQLINQSRNRVVQARVISVRQ